MKEMKEVIKGTLPNKKDVLRPKKEPVAKAPKAPKQPIVETPKECVCAQTSTEPTLVETMKIISKGGIIQDISTTSPLHILAFVLLIPAAIIAIPGFLLLLLSDHLKED